MLQHKWLCSVLGNPKHYKIMEISLKSYFYEWDFSLFFNEFRAHFTYSIDINSFL